MAFSWETLERIFHVQSAPSPAPLNGVVSSDVSIDPARNLWLRLYVPSTTTAADRRPPVIVYFHGGGFVAWAPDRKPYDDLCRALAAQSGAVLASVNYRLAPEWRCPAQYEDGFEALRFLDSGGVEGLPGDVDMGKCIIAGDSAGGNLAHHVAVMASEFPHFQVVKVIGLITIQPFFTAIERCESELRLIADPVLSLERTDRFWELFLPEGSERDHPAASVFGPKGKDISASEGFPKTLVITGGSDPLQGWGRSYYEWLVASGKDAKLVDYPGAPHCFYSTVEMPDYSAFVSEVKGFVSSLVA